MNKAVLKNSHRRHDLADATRHDGTLSRPTTCLHRAVLTLGFDANLDRSRGVLGERSRGTDPRPLLQTTLPAAGGLAPPYEKTMAGIGAARVCHVCHLTQGVTHPRFA